MEDAERAVVFLKDGTARVILVAVSPDESLYEKVLLDDMTTATFLKLSREGYPMYEQDELRPPTGIF